MNRKTGHNWLEAFQLSMSLALGIRPINLLFIKKQGLAATDIEPRGLVSAHCNLALHDS